MNRNPIWNQTAKVREKLAAVLSSEHALRNGRIARGEEWVEAEVGAMHIAVNRERLDRGLDIVTRFEVERLDAMAAGHCDYAGKFALYCAELAVGIKEVKP